MPDKHYQFHWERLQQIPIPILMISMKGLLTKEYQWAVLHAIRH